MQQTACTFFVLFRHQIDSYFSMDLNNTVHLSLYRSYLGTYPPSINFLVFSTVFNLKKILYRSFYFKQRIYGYLNT